LRHALVGLRRPGGGGIGRRDHLRRLAIGIGLSRFVESGKIFPNRARLTLLLGPVQLIGRFAVIRAGIGLQHAGVDGKALTLHQPHRHRRPHDAFEDMAQQAALAKAPEPVLRESRVMRDLVIEIERTKPAVRQVKLHLLAQLPLRADAIAVADDEHPDHQLGID